uniref:SH3 domain-containing protein n=1 Tax=Amphilophus citrinellus TaxID=61819 RepID=A0A3Q0RH78_AMPCI
MSVSLLHPHWELRPAGSLVKAVNTAVDLIVAHFGTSRDPDVKAKLGNSWVSPNVGHLILKYLCPALRDVLQDGLKAYVLDLIIGQRRCQPWSLVEASTQLGPSTRVLHSLFSKVSQYSELTSHIVLFWQGVTAESMTARPDSRGTVKEVGFAHLWKERGVEGQRVKGVGQESHGECEDIPEKDKRKEKDRVPADEGRQRQDRQAGWWYQLMQSSQVYIDQSTEGSKFVKTEKRKKSSERRQGQLPPTREGVVEGAEASQEGEGEKTNSSSLSREPSGSRGRPSWMGSPPESVLNQEKETNSLEVTGTGPHAGTQAESPSQGQSLRWGRLFGSSVGSPSRAEGAEQKAKAQKTRPPSGWLGLDRSVLDLVALTIAAGSGKKADSPHLRSLSSSLSEVRALCHHIATEPGQLSFNKGDILRVLSKADPDWLLCSLGSTQGLVPIVYVTLNSMEDSQDATGLGRC